MTALSNQFAPVVPETLRPTYETKHGSARVSPEGYVHNVNIRERDRGQGHGTALMGEIVADADRIGQTLMLHAREELHPWYERMGFQRHTVDVLGPLLIRQPRR